MRTQGLDVAERSGGWCGKNSEEGHLEADCEEWYQPANGILPISSDSVDPAEKIYEL